jgi:cellobiose dehydrogenase (acceptor)
MNPANALLPPPQQCSSQNGINTGWCGVSFDGSMTQSLLLLAYPQDGEVLTSLRFTTGYDLPAVYAGDATVTAISSSVNETHYTLVYRCQGCFAWDHNGNAGSASTSAGYLVLGWAQAFESPTNAECPDDVVVAQHDDQYIFGARFDANAMSEQYEEWTALATGATNGECVGGGGGGGGGSDGGSGGSDPVSTSSAPAPAPTTTSAAPVGTPVPTGTAYDYIVIGSGAGGIPVADRLSETGASVLLIEKGPVSSGRWGGDVKPAWLDGTNLTRFDVPGLCNQIWADSAGIACTDTDQMAGCVLGGGTAINAGLWWRPNPTDWDSVFPAGWQAADMEAAADRVFARIPGTETPSRAGEV